MRNIYNKTVLWIALLATILPIGSSGSVFDFFVIPILISACIIKSLQSTPVKINTFLFIVLLALLPLVVNITTCHQVDILALGITLRTIALIYIIGILLSNLKSRSRDILWISQVLIGFIALYAIASIVLKLSGLSITFSTPFISSRSYNGDPHVIGPIMAFSAMFGLQLIVFYSSPKPFLSSIARPIVRVVLVVFTLIAFLLSILTGSRGALLVYISSALFLFFRYFSKIILFVSRPTFNIRYLVAFLSAIIIATVSLFFLLDSSMNDANSLYNPSRVFAVMEILSGDDSSRSGTISRAIEIIRRPDMHLAPRCDAVSIADNGLAFMYLNHGSLFAVAFIALLFHIFCRLSSPFSRAVLFSTILFTTIASEAIFLPRFFSIVFGIILASESARFSILP